jgi:3-isopropylmalate/(R)-2-methylmalate dehydratase small subunit
VLYPPRMVEDELYTLPALRGRAWVFGDHIAADAVLPAAHQDRPPNELGPFAMAGIDPTFHRALDPGDFIVAGLDFAAGPARPLSAVALQAAGVGAVIARSFGEDFVRAATRIGLPALVIEETGAIKTGDRLRVDIETRKVVNLSSGDRYVIRNLTEDVVDVLRGGGLAENQPARRRP